MKKEELQDIENDLRKLSMFERKYFHVFLINEYPIVFMTYDIDTIIFTIDDIEADYKILKRYLNDIHVQSRLDAEKLDCLEELDGWNDVEKKLKDLSIIERMYFKDWLNREYREITKNHEIDTLIDTLLNIASTYQEIDDILNAILDHSKWDIEESEYLQKCNDLDNELFQEVTNFKPNIDSIKNILMKDN